MQETVGDRVKKARKYAKMTQIALAKAVNTRQGAISDLENNRNKSSTNLVKMAIVMGVNAEWLSTGKGEMIKETPEVLDVAEWEEGSPVLAQDIAIDYYSDLSFACGDGYIAELTEDDSSKIRISRAILDEMGVIGSNAFAARAKDDSMSPRIFDGDMILVDKSRTNIKDGKIYAIEHGGLYRCKRIYQMPNGAIRLVSDNKDEFKEIVLTKKQQIDEGFRIIGWVWSIVSFERWIG
ncbi:XRE family transcriptional regulator [Psychrobacter sp. I-STPA6b]|uniref:XRE family transcriptional regulator n=1 Tax=Psychrobacter sp. I-STPA6b TaxID=2585718 RepID=UPI001D0CBB3D|nr:helix-turn-helix transcriptional regulator [Psychrobacter sp. I-STPA6b]